MNAYCANLSHNHTRTTKKTQNIADIVQKAKEKPTSSSSFTSKLVTYAKKVDNKLKKYYQNDNEKILSE